LTSLKHTVKQICRQALPLSLRKKIAVWLSRQDWIGKERRNWWSCEIIRDLAEKDVNEYHRFLWSNHLSYAETYEPEDRFGVENIKESRKLFFSDLQKVIRNQDLFPHTDVQSVFEVGCSLGYLLRYIETDIFPTATTIMGNDIDTYAISKGTEYLRRQQSKVQLLLADMTELKNRINGLSFDIVLSTGVLMYLKEEDAAGVVKTMMNHTRVILAIAGLAHPKLDNAQLDHSIVREKDGAFIHNIDAMIHAAGGKIINRRWEGDMDVDGNTIYFLFANPPSKSECF